MIFTFCILSVFETCNKMTESPSFQMHLQAFHKMRSGWAGGMLSANCLLSVHEVLDSIYRTEIKKWLIEMSAEVYFWHTDRRLNISPRTVTRVGVKEMKQPFIACQASPRCHKRENFHGEKLRTISEQAWNPWLEEAAGGKAGKGGQEALLSSAGMEIPWLVFHSGAYCTPCKGSANL